MRRLRAAGAQSLFVVGPATAGSSSVAALQVALRAHGQYPAAVDGVQGPLTLSALTSFQRAAWQAKADTYRLLLERLPSMVALAEEIGGTAHAIDDLAADFPNLKIIMAHPGWPWRAAFASGE